MEYIEEEIKRLEEQLKNGKIEVQAFKEALKKYNEIGKKFFEIIQWAIELNRDNKELVSLYQDFVGKRSSELVEFLRKLGFRLSEDRELRDSFDKQSYRLLEQVRAGRRDLVFYNILRIFVSQKKVFPLELIEAFKPFYSDEMFKIFLFSFLSGILRKEEEGGSL